MKIEDYKEEDGEITFDVFTDRYLEIQDALREAGIHAGGRYLTGDTFSIVFTDAPIDKVNEVLAQIEE